MTRMPWWTWAGTLIGALAISWAAYSTLQNQLAAFIVSVLGGAILGHIAQTVFGEWLEAPNKPRPKPERHAFGSTQDDWNYLELIASLTGTVTAKERGFEDTAATEEIAMAVSRAIQHQLSSKNRNFVERDIYSISEPSWRVRNE